MRHPRIARRAFVTALIASALALGGAPQGVDASAGSEFVGSTPCDALPRRFVGVPAGAACERISWELTLSSDQSGRPSEFTLAAVYGMQARNDPGFVNGGTRLQLRGTWTVLNRRAADPDSAIYRIVADGPQRSLDFVRLGEDLLHPLNEHRALMVGTASWSYTLSRRGAPRERRRAAGVTVPDAAAARGTAATTAAGVFEGRTPCQELATLLRADAGSDCTKIKWRLTLERPRQTGGPAGYKLEGFKYRNPPRTGTWTIRTAADPKRVIYQLDPDERGGFLSFLKADDNLLLFLDGQGALLTGDAHYSYTLNRTR